MREKISRIHTICATCACAKCAVTALCVHDTIYLAVHLAYQSVDCALSTSGVTIHLTSEWRELVLTLLFACSAYASSRLTIVLSFDVWDVMVLL